MYCRYDRILQAFFQKWITLNNTFSTTSVSSKKKKFQELWKESIWLDMTLDVSSRLTACICLEGYVKILAYQRMNIHLSVRMAIKPSQFWVWFIAPSKPRTLVPLRVSKSKTQTSDSHSKFLVYITSNPEIKMCESLSQILQLGIIGEHVLAYCSFSGKAEGWGNLNAPGSLFHVIQWKISICLHLFLLYEV